MLVVQDQVWGRVTENRSEGKSTRYYMDEMHLLLREEQTAAYTVEIWKRFRKWGGIPTGITQNVKDLLASKEVENIFENSDFILMLNQAVGDRGILAKQLRRPGNPRKTAQHQPASAFLCHTFRRGRRASVLWECRDSICRPLPEEHGALQGDDDEAGRDNAGGRSKKSAFSRRGGPGRSFPKQRAESRPPDYG